MRLATVFLVVALAACSGAPDDASDASTNEGTDAAQSDPADAAGDESADAGATETPDAGVTETPDAGDTETPDAGDTETPDAGPTAICSGTVNCSNFMLAPQTLAFCASPDASALGCTYTPEAGTCLRASDAHCAPARSMAVCNQLSATAPAGASCQWTGSDCVGTSGIACSQNIRSTTCTAPNCFWRATATEDCAGTLDCSAITDPDLCGAFATFGCSPL